jgi:O-antigen/teichoic acid export membrane protein
VTLKILSRDVAFYGLLDFLQRSLGIVLIPIYTRVLSQRSYGDLDLILTVFSALTVFVDLQFVAGFSRFYLERRRHGRGAQFAGTVILTRVAIGVVAATVFLTLGFSGFLETKFFPSFLGHRAAWTAVAVTIPISFAYDLLLLQAQMLRWKKSFFAGAFGNTVLTTMLCIVFTIVIPLGINGVLLGQLLGKLVACCVLFVALRREIAFDFERGLLVDVARYTLPLVPAWWLGFSSSYVARFFVYAEQGAESNAILSITTKLAGLLGLFYVAFRSAWQPLAMSYIGDENGEQFYVGSLRLFMVGGMFAVFCLVVVAGPILTILAPAPYRVVEHFLPWFLVAALFGELDMSLQIGNQISMKTYWISLSSALAFAINLVVLVAFTARLGVIAAGLGLLVSFVAKTAISYYSAQRNHRIEYDRRALLIFIGGCIALLALSMARNAAIINNGAFLSVAVLLAIALPWFTLAVPERQMVKCWVTARVTRNAE